MVASGASLDKPNNTNFIVIDSREKILKALKDDVIEQIEYKAEDDKN